VLAQAVKIREHRSFIDSNLIKLFSQIFSTVLWNHNFVEDSVLAVSSTWSVDCWRVSHVLLGSENNKLGPLSGDPPIDVLGFDGNRPLLGRLILLVRITGIFQVKQVPKRGLPLINR
jgi:hypothetical protein